MFGGRDIHFMREVSERTGIQLVACTGIYTYDYLPHFYGARDADAIAEMFVHDLEQGIQGTDVGPASSSAPPTSRASPRTSRSCIARVRARACAPARRSWPTPGRPAAPAPSRSRSSSRRAWRPRRSRSPIPATPTTSTTRGLLDKGVWIGLDRFGLPMFNPEDTRIEIATELLRRGHADRLFIGSDFATSIDWFPQEPVEALMASGIVDPEWSMAYPFEKVLPRLREAGVWDDDGRGSRSSRRTRAPGWPVDGPAPGRSGAPRGPCGFRVADRAVLGGAPAGHPAGHPHHRRSPRARQRRRRRATDLGGRRSQRRPSDPGRGRPVDRTPSASTSSPAAPPMVVTDSRTGSAPDRQPRRDRGPRDRLPRRPPVRARRAHPRKRSAPSTKNRANGPRSIDRP